MARENGHILTLDEVRDAIYADFDFPKEELKRLSAMASSFLKEKTGYDFSKDTPREPLAVQACMIYVKQQYFQGEGYNKEYDYSFGLGGLIADLQVIADQRKEDE